MLRDKTITIFNHNYVDVSEKYEDVNLTDLGPISTVHIGHCGVYIYLQSPSVTRADKLINELNSDSEAAAPRITSVEPL